MTCPVVGGASSAPPTIQSFALPGEPGGGPGTVQEPRPFSKDVVPCPVDTSTSSTNTPSKEAKKSVT